jgi:hypothetical protein
LLPTAFGDTFHNLGSRRLRVALASFWPARSDVSCVLGSVNPLAVLASLACRRNRSDSGSIRKQSGKRDVGHFRNAPRGWHTQPMNALWLTLLFAAPWLAAIAYTWSRAPRMDGPPPSMAERTRERLWPKS